MATRRWIKNLERWIDGSGSTTEAVAKRSRHKTAHVLELFADPAPNPTMRLYLDLVSVAGARLKGIDDNTPAAVVAHLAALVRDKGLTVSSLARTSGVSRQQLSTLFNDADPSPTLATIDRLVAELGAEPDFGLVRASQAADAADTSDDDGEADAEADDDDDAELDDDDADADEEAELDDAADADEEAELDDAADDDDEAELDDDDDEEAELDDDDDEEAELDDDAEEAELDDEDGEIDDQAADGDAPADGVLARQTLEEQNNQLQRRVWTSEAEVQQLREQGRWSTLKKLAAAVGGGLVGAGITAAVLKRRKE